MDKNITENSIANVIKTLAIIVYFAGLICGFIFGIEEYHYHYIMNWTVAIIWWVSAFFSGTILLGFSEIINLLHKINCRMASTPIPPDNKQADFSDLPRL